jgi:tRNA (cytidine/uridine-2'-O-)-methyltransferase
MLNIVLFQPEIPQNTGNIARTCAVLGARLHLIRPFGFRLTDPGFKRSVMDYLEGVEIVDHAAWGAFLSAVPDVSRVFLTSGLGGSPYTGAAFERGDYLVFGPESDGLPPALIKMHGALTIPMPGSGRGLNVAVSVGIVAFEAARQITSGWTIEPARGS